MKKNKVIGGMMFVALNAVAGTASAVVTSETVVDFTNLTASAITGLSNLNTLTTTGTSKVYLQNGIAVGVVADPLSLTVHVHKESGTPTGTAIYYGNDTSGIYFRAQDGSAFSFSSMLFNSSYDVNLNPHTTVASTPGGTIGDGNTAHDFWDIYGFSTASNPGLLTDHLAADGFTPTDPNTGFPTAPAVAHATVANGFNGILNVLALDGNFKNVGSVWIHYDGFPHDPNVYVNPNDPNAVGTYAYGLIADNITLNQAVTASAVPVPGAVWLFATGVAGLMSFGRRKAAMVA